MSVSEIADFTKYSFDRYRCFGKKYQCTFFGQMPLASDPRTAHVSIIVMPNSLNIHLTGIHALGNLFSVKFYEPEAKMKSLGQF